MFGRKQPVSNRCFHCEKEMETDEIRWGFAEETRKKRMCKSCRTEEVRAAKMKKKDHRGFYAIIEHTMIPKYLEQDWEYLLLNKPDVFRKAWIMSSGLHKNYPLWKKAIEFAADNGVNLMSKSDRFAYDRLKDTITIYRGGITDEGPSWTLSKDTAKFFAEKFEDGKIYEQVVKKEDVLALITERHENEILLKSYK